MKTRILLVVGIWVVLAASAGNAPAWADDEAAAMAAGNAARQRGDYAAAIKHYRAAVATAPKSYEPKFQLARTLSFANQREEAIRLYTELLVTRPNNSDLLLARGRTYAWEGRWGEAETDLLAVTARSPGYGDAWSALGDMYLWSDRPDSAVKAYGRWISAQPAESRAYLARAGAYRSMGNLAAARADLEMARARGASAAEVDRLLAALERRSEPEAVRPEGFRWGASVGYSASSFSPDRDKWNEYNASLRRYWDRGSLAVEYLKANRFDLTDDAIALDAYIDLWLRAYANVRYQHSPDGVLYPEQSYRVELFQGAGQGWELSGSYDRLNFTSTSVDMYGVGLGKYTGNWYFRWRTLFIPSTSKNGLSHRAIARYYFSGDADDYVELNGGFSRGGDFRGNSQIIDVTSSWTVGAAVRKYFSPRWGVKVSADYSNEQTVNPFTERSISASLLYRW
ncbi:MAG: YaiO family outer membrane beta-barrel protein [Pseudomonadota bacterium]